MDNDLMARRLRPPSQPTPGNGQQPNQAPSPWDVPLVDGQFAPPDDLTPPHDPQFAPPDGQYAPDPQARADVPWDRPEPEAWPPADDAADLPQTWSAQGGGPAAQSPQPDWPVPDSASDEAAPPWDTPAAHEADQSHDPYDAMAPVVSDVAAAPAGIWAGWNGNGHHATPDLPEPMKVAAHSDGPLDSDESRSAPWGEPGTAPTPGSASASGSSVGPDPVPDWPAEDDLTVAPPTNRGPVMPEDSWPVTPPAPPPAAPPIDFAPPDPIEPEPGPELAAPAEPSAVAEPQAAEQPAAEPVAFEPAEAPPVAAEPVATEPAEAQPVAAQSPASSVQAVVMPPGATPQNMVLRIEVAIVDESRRANPADAAKRVGPDADVRRPEYEPRNHGGRAPMPEPEYLWDVPPEAPDEPQRREPRRPAPANAQPPAPARRVSPPPSAWQPAAPVPPEPMTMDWELPTVGGPQPVADPPAPWSTPARVEPPHQPPAQAPAPTWGLTQPTPPYQPPAPQYQPPAPPAYQPPAAPQYPAAYPPQAYQPPAAPQDYQAAAPPQDYQAAPPQDYQAAPPQPTWPPAQPSGPGHDPLAGLPAAPYIAPPSYVPPAQYAPAPQMSAQPQMPAQPFQSAPAAGSRARTGQVAADQADLWFLSNQPASTTLEDDEAQPEGRTSSILTAGLTIGFALLVIVLVLVFIQLMTSLLR